jgi:hypothetical protein
MTLRWRFNCIDSAILRDLPFDTLFFSSSSTSRSATSFLVSAAEKLFLMVAQVFTDLFNADKNRIDVFESQREVDLNGLEGVIRFDLVDIEDVPAQQRQQPDDDRLFRGSLVEGIDPFVGFERLDKLDNLIFHSISLNKNPK